MEVMVFALSVAVLVMLAMVGCSASRVNILQSRVEQLEAEMRGGK